MRLLIFFLIVAWKSNVQATDLNDFKWEIKKNELSGFLEARLKTQSELKTRIFYSWDKQGILRGEQSFDNDYKVIAPFPSLTLDWTHPGTGKSLEAKFLYILRSMGYKNLRLSFITIDQTIRPFKEWLDIADKQDLGKSLEDHLSFIEELVHNSVQRILDDKMPRVSGLYSPTMVRKVFNHLEVIEPVISGKDSFDVHGSRFDAFTLLSSKEYSSDKNSFLDHLYRVARLKSWFPLEWFAKSIGLKEKTKLAILSLITHNHLAERFFIESVIRSKGVFEGWKAIKAVNSLYRLERQFWNNEGKKYEIKKNNKIQDIGLRSNVAFIQEEMKREITSNKILRKKGTYKGGIPVYRTYHFYGAFILGRRLIRLIPLDQAPLLSKASETLVKILTQYAGHQYKSLSGGKNTLYNEMIKSVYHSAADIAANTEFFYKQRKKGTLFVFLSGRVVPKKSWNTIPEMSLGTLISSKAKKNYERVKVWKESSGKSSLEFVESEIANLPPGEKIDIYSIHHGPDLTFLPDALPSQVEEVFGHNRIRNVYSSGCQMWGDLELQDTVASSKVTMRLPIAKHMKNLGVHQYLIFTGKTEHWWKAANDFVPRINSENNWGVIAFDLFSEFDRNYENKPKLYVTNPILTEFPNPEARLVVGSESKVFLEGDSRIGLTFHNQDGPSEYILEFSK